MKIEIIFNKAPPLERGLNDQNTIGKQSAHKILKLINNEL
jgi:hypothetical protein